MPDSLPEEEPEITPEALATYIRGTVLESRRSAKHRKPIKKGTLRALCSWERELTSNYGVVKR